MAPEKNKNLQPLPHDDDDHDIESLEAYIRQTYSTAAAIDELRRIYEDEGSEGAGFQEALSDMTFDALDQNEEFMDNAKRLRKGGLSAEQDAALRQQQRDMMERYKQAIIHEAGLPDESGADALAQAKARVSHILSEKLQGNENAQIDDILSTLGIIVVNEKGEERFHYPEDLFPSQTNAKWNTYIASVLEHVRQFELLEQKLGSSQAEVQEADSVRTLAHTAVTKDIDAILGLSELDDKQWDFKKTRELVAKMRDKRLPTVETRESQMTAMAIADGLIGVHALKTLIKKR